MTQEITIICPICGDTRTEPSLEVFLQKVREAWDYWRPIPEDIERKLQKANNPERLKRLLKEKGYLTAFCRDCATAATVVAARTILEVE